ncbi:palladin-like [Fukomys damarensis]|uniref:palladin-like n=1 Tax=Fukomys damarensis TaxID=885580 RepID=UPI001455747C|nr:palladin-like [Fukomys damarensis]
MSETSSHDSFYDSLSDMQEESKNADFFPGLSAFLSQEEINKSLDLARRAIANSETEDFDSEKEISQIFNSSPVCVCENPSHKETKLGEQISSGRLQNNKLTSIQLPAEKPNERITSPASRRKSAVSPQFARPSYIRSLRKAGKRGAKTLNTNEKPKPAHQSKAGPQSELCDKAANFIEELTSIFRGVKPRSRSPNGELSSPDSGYLSPKNQPSNLRSTSASQSPTEDHQEMEAEVKRPEAMHCYQADQPVARPRCSSASHPQPLKAPHFQTAPRFIQKLRSQEVEEGSRVYLECRVTGNPTPRIRWFCEGKELHNTPDIQIFCEGGDLHTLIIAEAFEEDTGRYTCLATNPCGSDTTSAEVFIEGASSTDSETENLAFKSKAGDMPQAQKKTTSVSLTIGSSSPKAGVTTAVIQPLSVPAPQVHSPTSYLCRPDGTTAACFPPVFTKELQNTTASEGQVVVLECRVRGAPPLHVQWFRQGVEIQDSPDFRILQKKPRSTAEPEEICTLVIAETFPEDAGVFTCSARNDFGSVTSTAQLVVTPESCSHNTMGNSNKDHFPPPPPILETNSFELASKKPSETQQGNRPDFGLSMAALHMQFNSAERETNGVHPSHGVNGLINGKTNGNKSLPTPAVLLSPTKEPPPLLAKPKLDPLQIQQLQNQIRLEQEARAPPSPPFALLPSQPPPVAVNALGLPKGVTPAYLLSRSHLLPLPFSFLFVGRTLLSVGPQQHGDAFCLHRILVQLGYVQARIGMGNSVRHQGFPKKASRTARIASDEEIQGTKDAVIQDLERKLRFKEDLLNNGQPLGLEPAITGN